MSQRSLELYFIQGGMGFSAANNKGRSMFRYVVFFTFGNGICLRLVSSFSLFAHPA